MKKLCHLGAVFLPEGGAVGAQGVHKESRDAGVGKQAVAGEIFRGGALRNPDQGIQVGADVGDAAEEKGAGIHILPPGLQGDALLPGPFLLDIADDLGGLHDLACHLRGGLHTAQIVQQRGALLVGGIHISVPGQVRGFGMVNGVGQNFQGGVDGLQLWHGLQLGIGKGDICHAPVDIAPGLGTFDLVIDPQIGSALPEVEPDLFSEFRRHDGGQGVVQEVKGPEPAFIQLPDQQIPVMAAPGGGEEGLVDVQGQIAVRSSAAGELLGKGL